MPETLPLFDQAPDTCELPRPARSVFFFVPGVPQPGGSKKGFPVKRRGGGVRVVIVEDAKHNPQWRAVVSLAAAQEIAEPFKGPIAFVLNFLMPRPKNHYRTGRHAGQLKPNAPAAHTIYPDTTKLIRSTEDALTGIAWADDAQVVDQHATKMYADDGRPGCWIRIEEWRA